MIRYHFGLQLKRLSRLFDENGLIPIFGFVGIPILLILLGQLIYMREDYGPYAIAGLSALFSMDMARLDLQFRRSLYGKWTATYIALLESLVLALPFLLLLLWHQNWPLAGALLGLCTLTPFTIGSISRKAIKTPFYKIPFEFIRGFRMYWPLYIFLFFILFQAISVHNFNLGAFVLGACSISSLFFYSYQEPPSYVIDDIRNENSFLFSKLRHAWFGNLILCSVITAILLFFFTDNWLLITGIIIAGQILLSAMVLAKYSAYPRDMQLPQIIMLGFIFWLPPTIVIVIPLLYRSAKKSLYQYSRT